MTVLSEICKQCGAEIRPGKKFCLHCGQPIPLTHIQSCKQCGAEIRPGKKFCLHCGQPVPLTHIQSCKQCGAEIRPGKKFCLRCGQPVPPKFLHGRYRIIDIVGQGGMSTIYRAEDNDLGQRLVALKEMKLTGLQSSEQINSLLRSFEQEALILANLSHPYLPSIYDHFTDNEHWYIVMQYIRGETLSQRLRTLPDRRVLPQEVLDISIKLCEVLGYLHAQKPPVIFSDLKPDNIMLTPEGNIYLIDFGIARLYETAVSDDKKFISRGYSPPEQYYSALLSPHADIYSLGATLHQMFSGQQPSKSNGFAPLQLGSQPWAVELEAVVMSMLKQRVEERPPNIIVVKQALQRITNLLVQDQSGAIDKDKRVSVWDKTSWENLLDEDDSVGETEPSPTRGLTPGWQPTSSWSFSMVPTIPNVTSISSSEISNPATSSPSLPASITSSDLRLMLRSIDALDWSPDGSCLIAGNGTMLHMYTWPPEEHHFAFEDESLVPLRTWSLQNLLRTESSANVQKSSGSWNDVSTVPRFLSMEQSFMLTWAPDSIHIAITGGTLKGEIFVLDTRSEEPPVSYGSYKGYLWTLAWSPDGKFIAMGGDEHTVQVKEIRTQKNIASKVHSGSVTAIIWSPDSKLLASASSDGAILVWNAKNEREVCTYQGHSEYVHTMLWMADGKSIISCGEDHTIQVWNAKTAQKLRSLEAHTESVQNMAFLDQGRLLTSLSRSGTIYIWDTVNWGEKEMFKSAFFLQFRNFDVSFHPKMALIAKSTSLGIMSIYEIDLDQVYNGPTKTRSIQYTNAKVVLLGDSGVGKTALGLALSHQGFQPTMSTHARKIWTLAMRESKLPDGRKEIHETLLWDLAGQPGYRLIHQLHLSEVAVALIVFDAHNETDPFAGIAHWVHALQTAQRVRGNTGAMKMLLVSARIDRGGIHASRERINEFIQQMGFDGYYTSSAKEGTNIPELATAIKKAIAWDQFPKVTSTELFQHIRNFLVGEKQAGQFLAKEDNLYRSFLWTWSDQEVLQDLSGEFLTGIRLLEATGLIRKLNFGNLILLQPELLDTYASALVNMVRTEPDGLGSISEEAVLRGNFAIPAEERMRDYEQERLLLIAMIQDLLYYEIALREQGEDGPYLIFPSESTRENPALPNPENASSTFTFEGPVRNIYATLVVRLSHTGLFYRKELWKDAVVYTPKAGGLCGISLKEIEDGTGELTLFFNTHTSYETCFHFEEYIRNHLLRKALPEKIRFRRIIKCTSCGLIASEQLIQMRIARNFNWFTCPGCDARVSLHNPAAALSRVPEMDRAADMQRNRATTQSIVQGKHEIKEFDVFLCYNKKDQEAVIEIGESLKEQSILPWLDIWEIRPGQLWQKALEQQIGQIKSAAIFVGENNMAPWQEYELDALLREFVRRKCPVIPVLLKDAPYEPNLPVFLQGMRWVDLREHKYTSSSMNNPLEQLIWGITGVRKPI
jgi:serine/threonine protein kinase/GTPase SAR1 family protein